MKTILLVQLIHLMQQALTQAVAIVHTIGHLVK